MSARRRLGFAFYQGDMKREAAKRLRATMRRAQQLCRDDPSPHFRFRVVSRPACSRKRLNAILVELGKCGVQADQIEIPDDIQFAADEPRARRPRGSRRGYY